MSESSSNNKRIAKNTLLLYSRSILLILISLYTSRAILEVLGVTDYGIYNLIGGIVTMFSMLSGSMATASQRFITYALGEKNSDVKKVFSTSLTLHLILGIVLVVALGIGGSFFIYNGLNIPTERLFAANSVLYCSIFTFFINVISIPYNALIIAHERMSAFAYISILDAMMKLVAVFVLWIIPADKLIVYAVLVSCISLVQRFIYSSYCKKHFQESRNIRYQIDDTYFKKMFSFAGWNLWGSGSAVLRNQGIDILLNLFFGVTVNAAKGICNQVQNAIYQFVTNFQLAIVPQLTKSIAQKELGRAHELIFQGGRFSFYLLTILSIPVLVSTPQLLSIWLVEVPEYTVEFVRWTIIYLLWDCLSRCLINAIQAQGDIKSYQIIVGGSKLLALPLAYVILKMGGSPVTGIWVNIVLELVCISERLYFTYKKVGLSPLDYIKYVILKCWVVFGLSISLPILYSLFINKSALYVIPVALIISMASIYLFGFQKAERYFILQKIKFIFFHFHS